MCPPCPTGQQRQGCVGANEGTCVVLPTPSPSPAVEPSAVPTPSSRPSASPSPGSGGGDPAAQGKGNETGGPFAPAGWGTLVIAGLASTLCLAFFAVGARRRKKKLLEHRKNTVDGLFAAVYARGAGAAGRPSVVLGGIHGKANPLAAEGALSGPGASSQEWQLKKQRERSVVGGISAAAWKGRGGKREFGQVASGSGAWAEQGEAHTSNQPRRKKSLAEKLGALISGQQIGGGVRRGKAGGTRHGRTKREFAPVVAGGVQRQRMMEMRSMGGSSGVQSPGRIFGRATDGHVATVRKISKEEMT